MPTLQLNGDGYHRVHVGDTVHVSGTVVRRIAEMFEVEIYGRGGPTEITFNADQITAVEVPDPPAEPDNGAWVIADDDTNTSGMNVFHRHDGLAPAAEGRRWPLRWQDVAGGGWVDWPTVVSRGGNPDHQLLSARPIPGVDPPALMPWSVPTPPNT